MWTLITCTFAVNSAYFGGLSMDCLTFCPTTRRVPTRTGTLVVHDSGGAGRPLLLWPSLFTDHTLYDGIQQRLAGAWRTLAVEAPGFGDSDPLPLKAGPLAPAEGLPDLLDALGIGEVTIAGTAWGGQVAAAFAAAHPDRVAGLLLMNTPLMFGFSNHFLALALSRLVHGQTFFADGLAKAMLGDTTRREAPHLVQAFVERFHRFHPKDAARTAHAVIRQSTALPPLSGITCPTLLLFGDEDRTCPARTHLAWSQRLPNAQFRVVKECGPLAPLEAPADVVDALATLA